MEQETRQLFTDYILNRCSQTQVEAVLQKIREGGYELEWQAAMEEAEAELEKLSTAEIPQLQSKDKSELWQHIKHASGLGTTLKVQKIWWAFPAAAVILILAGYLFWFQPSAAPQPATSGGKIDRSLAAKADRKWLKLPDGTSVLTNSGSTLEFNEDFGKNGKREVTLSGEAFFDVSHDKSRPFIIHTGTLKTTVLGTAFNIKAYPGSDSVTVTVARGKVKVEDAMKTLAVLMPEQQLRWVSPGRGNPVTAKVDLTEVLDWKSEELIMDDITLEEAAAMIAGRYHLEVKFINKDVKGCRFTAAFLHKNELSQVLNVVGDITGTTLTVKDGIIYVDGAGCTSL